jgi:hypothetical protein
MSESYKLDLVRIEILAERVSESLSQTVNYTNYDDLLCAATALEKLAARLRVRAAEEFARSRKPPH